jgi:hypothetical protein
MRFAAWVFFTVSISLVLYMMGYTPVAGPFATGGGGVFLASANNTVAPTQCIDIPGSAGCPEAKGDAGGISSITYLLMAGLVATAVIFVLFFANFSAIYIIPLIIMGVLVNFFIIPWSFIMGAPIEIQTAGMVIFNIMTLLAMINFVRGPT